jgi:hypothetical protein
MPTNPLAVALESIELGPAVIFQNLTMIPLIATHQNREPRERDPLAPLEPLEPVEPLEPEYVLLDDALASGLVEITEVSEQGSVPDLKFVNRGPTPVLIVDGEELLGARQNRIVNLTILVPAHSELTIPLSCVEAGRWRARSRSFTSAPRTQFVTGRAKRMASVSYSMIARGDRVSDQAEVWDDIALKSSRLSAASPTSAMGAIFSTHAVSLDAFVAGCQPVDDQVGALFAIGGRVIGFDLFDRPSTLRKVLPKLVRGVAVDAIDAADAAEPADSSLVRALAAQFLAVTAQAPQHVTPALGLGEDRRLTAPHMAGAALVTDQHVVHLSAFAL